MIIRQFLHQDPVGISYLFGCGGRAAGAVVDPVGDIEPYLRAAEAAGMRIHFVIDTHVHADGQAGNSPRRPARNMYSRRTRGFRFLSGERATKRYFRSVTSLPRCCTHPATRRNTSAFS
jgi:hypothetical protein